MNKVFLLAFTLSVSICFGQQSIYKVFKEGMTKEEVSSAFEANKADLLNISFNKNIAWDIAINQFKYENNQLKVVCLIPSGMGNGFNYIKTVTQLKQSKDFLIDLGYQVKYENEYWNRPQTFVNQNYAYGLVLSGPKQENYVNLYTYKDKGNYIPVLYIFPFSYKNKHFTNNENAKVSESGF